MPINNHSITSAVNHLPDCDLSDDGSLPLADCDSGEHDDSAADALIGLRNACIAAREVLCESVLGSDFDHCRASNAIQNINNALVRASFLS